MTIKVAQERLNSTVGKTEIDLTDLMENIIGEIFGRMFFGDSFKDKNVNGKPLGIATKNIFFELFRESLLNSSIEISQRRKDLMNEINGIRKCYRSLIEEKRNEKKIDRVTIIYMLLEQQG